MFSYRTALLLCAATLPLPAMAQDNAAQGAAQDADETGAEGGDRAHQERIVVSAAGLEDLNFLAGSTVVQGEELLRNGNGQIGEVLDDLPGVSTSGFGPGASRPILRGLDGERVRILVDGIGAIDASNTSADHAVSIDPLTAESIEVLRGPATLLYGSSAIGGVVNVIDRRLPRELPEDGYRLDAFGSLDTAYDLREFGAGVDIGVAGGLVLHVDGSYRRTNDFEIPGFQLTDDLRADLLADAAEEVEEGHLDEAEELRETANIVGYVPNSATETYSFGGGLGYIGDGIRIAASASYFDSYYGIPSGPGGHHHEEEDHDDDDDDHDEEDHEEEHGEEVFIDLEQLRFDFVAAIELGGFFDEVTVRVGHSDYTHTEFEGDETGTIFDVSGTEGRIELTQAPTDNWRGAIGAQFFIRDFEAIGAEAFVPPNTTEQFALFTLQELQFGGLEVELGGRFEHTAQESDVLGIGRDFNTFSGAVGFSFDIPGGVTFGTNFSRTERAPSAEELFANGPHLATSQFEIGDPNLQTETAWGAEAYLDLDLGVLQGRLAVYHNAFSNFIYLSETGLEEDELPVFEFLQEDAGFTGFEAEAIIPLFDAGAGEVLTDLRASYVSAELSDGTALPRIPPLELLGALEWHSNSFDLRGEVQFTDAQSSVAPFEEATEDFTFVNFSAAWHPFADSSLTVLVQANNVFDVEGRRHTSFTKEFVPLAGRNFKLTVRAEL